jgi:excisionase family DNA binding protein
MLIAEDAAAYLGLGRQALAKMRLTGDSPPFFKVGRRVLYDRDELDAWLSTRKRRSTTDQGPK